MTGTKRAALSIIEQDFGVLMFFMGSKSEDKPTEKLAIFGTERSSKGAELKVKSSVESKSPGHFSSMLRENRKDWDRKGYLLP